jgi:hypothetical protein
VNPEFWPIWQANKDTLQKNGYSVRKNENDQWEVRFIPPEKSGWPPIKSNPIFVPTGMKASICLKCGHIKLIKINDEHKNCGICGEKIAPDPDE